MKNLILVAAGILITSTSWADTPEPIHHDDSPQPIIEPLAHAVNTTGHPYMLGHMETRHVDPRPIETCYQLTAHVVDEDFMKCRNGYDYKAWVPSHYVQ